MDKTTKRNQKIWNNMSKNGVLCSMPNSIKDLKIIQKQLDKHNIFGDVKRKNILCLASGGGQQSIQFALLGANVTVVDFSEEQLKQDKLAAQKFGVNINIIQSDMRDLSDFEDKTFDIIYQPYSINYIPGVGELFNEVTRIIKNEGIYYLMFHNPFVHGSWKDGSWGSEWKREELWKGKGYPIFIPYKEGYPIKVEDPTWNFENQKGEKIKIEAPQEYKHTLSVIINSLVERDFSILRLDEVKIDGSEKAEIGTWDHYVLVAAPWLFLWAKKLGGSK